MKWIKNSCRELLLVILVFPSVIHVDAAAGKVAPFILSSQVTELMENYCFDCHDADTQKGDVRLDNLETLALKDRLDLLNRMQEQIFIKEMPPKKKKQPSHEERKFLLDWLSANLNKHEAANFEKKLKMPQYGNYVNHDRLFSGEIKDKPYSPARRWIVSPYIFENRINRIYRAKKGGKMPEGLVNPFHLPDISGGNVSARMERKIIRHRI